MITYLWNWYYDIDRKSDIIKRFIKYCSIRKNYIKKRKASIKIQKWFSDHPEYFETEEVYNLKKRRDLKNIADAYVKKNKKYIREQRMAELV